jgi:hypothetical protein
MLVLLVLLVLLMVEEGVRPLLLLRHLHLHLLEGCEGFLHGCGLIPPLIMERGLSARQVGVLPLLRWWWYLRCW